MNKENNIEALRGIAIMLMVLGHVVGADSTKGLRVEEGSVYNYIFYIFQYLRMPLFTVISGYIYALKPVSINYDYTKFSVRKVKRLLIPAIISSTLFFIFQSLSPGTNTKYQLADVGIVFYSSYAHYWFAQGIFIVFIIVGLLDHLKLLNNPISFVILMSTALITYLFVDFGNNIFSSRHWPFLTLFFLLGVFIKRFNLLNKHEFNTTYRLILLLLISIWMIQQCFFYFQKTHFITPLIDRLFTVTIGICGAICLLGAKYSNMFLEKIGSYSYEIYLYHIFGTAGCRILLNAIGINSIFLNLIFGFVIGVSTPILFKIVTKKYSWADALVFGERTKSAQR